LISKTDYVGGMEFEDEQLKFISNDEGRVRPLAGTFANFKYEYDIKDHLGNVRMTITPDNNNVAQIIQEDSYYPFGLKIPGMTTITGSENKYTYNGKELVNDFDLNWYHYGARYYDPTLGRWQSIDPADEFHSPYVYCADNPVMLVDSDGCETQITTNKDNVITDMQVNFAKNKDQNVYVNNALVGLEPPKDSFFYEQSKSGKYVIANGKFTFDKKGFDDALAKDVSAAYKFSALVNELSWFSKSSYDFKYDHPNKVGLAFDTVMTSRDAGNVKWGTYCRHRYGFNQKILTIVSDAVAKRKEDTLSFSMQKWGLTLNPYNCGQRK